MNTLVLLVVLFLIVFVKTLFLGASGIVAISVFGRCGRPNTSKVLLNNSRNNHSIFGVLVLKTEGSLLVKVTVAILVRMVKAIFKLITNCCNKGISGIVVHFLSFVVILPALVVVVIVIAVVPGCAV